MKKSEIRLSRQRRAERGVLQPTSEARLRLAKLIDRRLGIEDRLRGLAEAAQRLRDAQAAEGKATAALANFEAADTAAMAEWSKSPSSPMPVSNPGKRDELEAAIRWAGAQASAARKAEAANTAEQMRENAAAKALGPALREFHQPAARCGFQSGGMRLPRSKRRYFSAVQSR
jgi:hypothetical protein